MRFRPAIEADIAAVMACERLPGYENSVGQNSREEHLAALGDPDQYYLIAHDKAGQLLGFVILQQLSKKAEAVLLRRIAVAMQGRGSGRALLEESFRIAFDEIGTPKLWLRVMPDNLRGLALYRAAGMIEEGIVESPHHGHMARMHVMAMEEHLFRSLPRSV